MPFQSQSSGGLFGGQLSSTIAPTMRSMQVEQALALLGEALRHELDELVVDARAACAPCASSRSSFTPHIW